MEQAEYTHTQHGHFHWLLFVVGGCMAAAATWGLGELVLETDAPPPPGDWVAFGVLLGFGLLVMIFGFCVITLTVTGDADRLTLTYGVLPLMRATFAYKDIDSEQVEVDRTRFIDGWGIHWIPWRGWTYNLWGFRCVRLKHLGRTIRIGTDDPEGLRDYLADRVRKTREIHKPSDAD